MTENFKVGDLIEFTQSVTTTNNSFMDNSFFVPGILAIIIGIGSFGLAGYTHKLFIIMDKYTIVGYKIFPAGTSAEARTRTIF